MVKWHNKIYTYYVPLPEGVNEAVMSCIDGYTIYIDETLDEEQKKKAFVHAMSHIANNDFDKDDVQDIEAEAHEVMNHAESKENSIR